MFCGPRVEALANGAVEALRAAGVETVDRTDYDAAVLFLDDASAEHCEAVRDLSHEGAVRVLVVVPATEALSGAAAWLLMDAGASDVVAWDRSPAVASEVADRLARWRSVDELVSSPGVSSRLVGVSAGWRRLLREIVDVARFTDASVLLTGESGTGKELVARLIHDLDPRPGKGELVVLDCTTIVPSLSGSEFFGHERGAFTGAVSAREGAFARADGGTLFLDEVGELTPSLQSELLRVVQEGTYKRVGSDTWRRTRFRLVCATNRDVAEVDDFRRDLYYRIAGWSFRLPSLRERPADVMPLVRHFIAAARRDDPTLELDESVRQLLVTREYPGNIRDLRHLVLRIASRHVGSGPITVGDVPTEERPHVEPAASWQDAGFDKPIRRAVELDATLREITTAAAEVAIRFAVEDAGGNLPRAATRLGVTPRALQLRRAGRMRAVGDGSGVN